MEYRWNTATWGNQSSRYLVKLILTLRQILLSHRVRVKDIADWHMRQTLLGLEKFKVAIATRAGRVTINRQKQSHEWQVNQKVHKNKDYHSYYHLQIFTTVMQDANPPFSETGLWVWRSFFLKSKGIYSLELMTVTNTLFSYLQWEDSFHTQIICTYSDMEVSHG